MVETRRVGDATTSPHPLPVLQATWDHLDALYRADPTIPRVAGARAAAEWCIGMTHTSPITGQREPAAGRAIGWEPHEAERVVMGLRPGDVRFADGAGAWLFWWLGVLPAPAWLTPRPGPAQRL